MTDYTEIWQLQDSITTVVQANGYSVWDLSKKENSFLLELTSHLEDEAISNLCGQFPITADYNGEGRHGTIITLYIE